MKYFLIIFCLFSFFAGYSQGGVKISDLPSATSLSGTEIVPIVQTTNKKATIGLMRGWNSIGTANQLLRVNSGATALEFFTPSYLSGVVSIANGGTGLSSLGTANQQLRVNAGGTALEYFTPSGGSTAWADITGKPTFFPSDTTLFWKTYGTSVLTQDVTINGDVSGTIGHESTNVRNALSFNGGETKIEFTQLAGADANSNAKISVAPNIAGGNNKGVASMTVNDASFNESYFIIKPDSFKLFKYNNVPTIGDVLTAVDTDGTMEWQAPAGGGLTVGTSTITSGTNTRILYNNSGVLGEYTISGSGNVAMTASPTFTGTPVLPSTFTIGSNSFIRSGAHGLTLTTTGTTNVTLPTSGTLAISSAAQTFTGTQTFSPTATVAGVNLGSVAGNPSSLNNYDMWFNSSVPTLGVRMAATTYYVNHMATGDATGNRIPFIASTSGRLSSNANLLYNGTQVNVPAILIGSTGTITSGAKVDIRGTGTTTSQALRIATSGNTEKLAVLDNGTMVRTQTNSTVTEIVMTGTTSATSLAEALLSSSDISDGQSVRIAIEWVVKDGSANTSAGGTFVTTWSKASGTLVKAGDTEANTHDGVAGSWAVTSSDVSGSITINWTGTGVNNSKIAAFAKIVKTN